MGVNVAREKFLTMPPKRKTKATGLQKSTKTKLDQAIEEGSRPRFPRGSQRYTIRVGNSNIVLVNADDSRTPAGLYYAHKTGRELPRGIDPEEAPVLEPGGSEFITVRGKKTMTRRWNPATNQLEYTKVGRDYYSKPRFLKPPTSTDAAINLQRVPKRFLFFFVCFFV